jgi:hypothetical protein
MSGIDRRAALAGLALAGIAGAANAQDAGRAAVEAFYGEFLAAAGPKDKLAVAGRILAPDWQSVGDYAGPGKAPADVAKTIEGFHKLIPDLAWKVEEMIVAGDRYVVRGRATGTPAGPLFGVDGKGRSFTIMSIDIHRVRDGRIVTSHHVEDWAGALRQLSGR